MNANRSLTVTALILVVAALIIAAARWLAASAASGTAFGNVCISFEVLPEPSTLGLLAMSGFALLCRRGHRPE